VLLVRLKVVMVHLLLVVELLLLAALEQQRMTGGGADCRPGNTSRGQHLGLQGITGWGRTNCLLQRTNLGGGTCGETGTSEGMAYGTVRNQTIRTEESK